MPDVFLLIPPGFGGNVAAGFDAGMNSYRNWLITELEQFGEPVDLVGHDWGGGHVVNVAMARPDLLRSWAGDAIGLFDPRYDWHDFAERLPSDDGETAIYDLAGPPLVRCGISNLTGGQEATGPRIPRTVIRNYRFLITYWVREFL
ncbi:alpha/beta hydrolase (plasmid) [Rhodococcus sp. USK10]|uniref:alpha/beta fold hydrolase n=1 Tax=Rhodococcus sp. USK10 TaxID=2789739 RepID=UPI001C5E23A7|nr:alpha/beta hydrolase [Rhodococcus sp. USK10]QYB00200.1 alpha/beta hydrolase [Rhodococcus sp. USK10]